MRIRVMSNKSIAEGAEVAFLSFFHLINPSLQGVQRCGNLV